jgi:hypothetical protein
VSDGDSGIGFFEPVSGVSGESCAYRGGVLLDIAGEAESGDGMAQPDSFGCAGGRAAATCDFMIL